MMVVRSNSDMLKFNKALRVYLSLLGMKLSGRNKYRFKKAKDCLLHYRITYRIQLRRKRGELVWVF